MTTIGRNELEDINIYPRCLTVWGWIVVYKMFGLAIAVTSAIEDLWLEMM